MVKALEEKSLEEEVLCEDILKEEDTLEGEVFHSPPFVRPPKRELRLQSVLMARWTMHAESPCPVQQVLKS